MRQARDPRDSDKQSLGQWWKVRLDGEDAVRSVRRAKFAPVHGEASPPTPAAEENAAPASPAAEKRGRPPKSPAAQEDDQDFVLGYRCEREQSS